MTTRDFARNVYKDRQWAIPAIPVTIFIVLSHGTFNVVAWMINIACLIYLGYRMRLSDIIEYVLGQLITIAVLELLLGWFIGGISGLIARINNPQVQEFAASMSQPRDIDAVILAPLQWTGPIVVILAIGILLRYLRPIIAPRLMPIIKELKMRRLTQAEKDELNNVP